MSGICGIFALDGSELELREIEAMTAPLEQRGPDGTHHWLGGSKALGHTLLATTPEALREVLPLTDPESGCTITADVRLDNREELIPALQLEGETLVIGDGELILRAYLQWGEACLEYFLGDFAFAIWDPRANRLFCGRDHMGMRQLIYCHVPGKLFVFATEPRAILTHEGVPHRLNEGRIAEYLDGLEAVDFTSTFLDEIYRLPPAHKLTVDADGLRIERYWELVPGPELKLGSDEAYAEAFLEVFTEAVRCRLRSAGPVGSMLSGGMDSSSITAVASELQAADSLGPLHTFSAVRPDSEPCPETRAIQAALTISGLEPHLIDYTRLDGFAEELIRLTKEIQDPFDGDMALVRSVYLCAHRAGIKVILDGATGDVVFLPGMAIPSELRNGHLLRAWREAQAEARFWEEHGEPAWKSFLSGAWRAFAPSILRRMRGWTMWRLWARRRDRGSLLDPKFAKKINLSARRWQYKMYKLVRRSSDAEIRSHELRQPYVTVARERYGRIASALAIEARDPFMDIRLLRFVVSLPWSQFQADGWTKIILRRAMEGKLPEAVQWRRSKQHLSRLFTNALFSSWHNWQTCLFNRLSDLEPYLKKSWIASVSEGDAYRGKEAKLIEILFCVLYLSEIGPKCSGRQGH